MNKPQLKTICSKIKLKPGSYPRALEWAKEINGRKDEAIITLVDEGVYLETVFIDRTEFADYLIYVMKLEDIDKAKNVVNKSIHQIDLYHKQFKKDCWDSKQELELLIDFERFDDFN